MNRSTEERYAGGEPAAIIRKAGRPREVASGTILTGTDMVIKDLERTARAALREAFETDATALAWAPGRVELLGNHTDYNGGLVLAAAVDRFTVVAGRRVEGRTARVRSSQFEGEEAFDVDD